MAETVERKALSEGLNALAERMRTMTELSELAIRKATEGLIHPDQAEIDAVFTLDQEIYALREVTMKLCVDLIALHAPVARDLRTIAMSLETTNDLDRIGRYAKDIVEIVQRLRDSKLTRAAVPGLERMVDLTIQMVHTAVEAFLRHDAAAVRDSERTDDEVDRMHDELFLAITHGIEDRSLPVEVGAQYILVNRYMERIADHAVNIGRHTTFMATGRHRLLRADVAEPSTSEGAQPAS